MKLNQQERIKIIGLPKGDGRKFYRLKDDGVESTLQVRQYLIDTLDLNQYGYESSKDMDNIQKVMEDGILGLNCGFSIYPAEFMSFNLVPRYIVKIKSNIIYNIFDSLSKIGGYEFKSNTELDADKLVVVELRDHEIHNITQQEILKNILCIKDMENVVVDYFAKVVALSISYKFNMYNSKYNLKDLANMLESGELTENDIIKMFA